MQHKSQISNWFLEHDREFIALTWPTPSPDISPIERGMGWNRGSVATV